MKKYWKLLLCAALGFGTFTACEDVPEPYNIPTENPNGNVTPTDSATEVTCAKAVELTAALADGTTSTESYAITGYITEVVSEVSRNQQTFWMADTQNGGRIFEAYWANLPEGTTEFKVGTKVKITGKLTKYVNNNTGKMTAEIKNATVEILEDGGETPPVTGTEVTCAQAAELTNALADGATSTEVYSITGYITEVVGSVSRNQQTFWMADTKDGGRVFEAYWANLPEGVTEFKVGTKVRITGQLMKYVKDGKVTPEIKNATVEILEDGGDTPTPPVTGTEVTCAQAAELTNALADGGTSTEAYTITGYITEVLGAVSTKTGTPQQSFWMADTKDGGKIFEAYYANVPTSISEFKVGMKVKITGQLMKYVKDGKVTPEIKNATVEILEDGGDTPTPPVTGTEVNCAQAAELTNALADGGTSTEVYTVTGYITEVVGSVSRNQQTFWMADTKDGGRVFEAYWANLPEGVSAFKAGSKVKITGQLMKYVKDGKVTPEIKNANVEILEEGDGGNGGNGGGDPTPGGTSLADFTNGDFEAWADGAPAHWKSVVSNATLEQSTDVHGGTYSVLVKGATANKRMAYEEMSLAPGTYTVVCWAKGTNDAAKIKLGYAKLTDGKVADTQNDYIYGDMLDIPAGSWTQVSYQFELTETTSVSLIVMNNKAGGKDVLIDDYVITKK